MVKVTEDGIILEEPVTLMWAYGSNLNFEAMRIRCPRAKPYRALYLHGGRLVFRGVADVEGVKDKRSKVAGGVWKVTPKCIATLDAYEGVASGLYVKRYFVFNDNGCDKACLFYKMSSVGIQPPYESYLEIIREGYEDFGLDQYLLESAVQHAHRNKNRTPDLHRRWLAKGKPKLALAKPNLINGRKR